MSTDQAQQANVAAQIPATVAAISKLMIAVQGNVYGQVAPQLTKELMEEVVEWKLREFSEKKRMAVDVDEYNVVDIADGVDSRRHEEGERA